MRTCLRILHLLALGMWFGSVTFCSFFTALPIIRHMETQAGKPDYWLHLEDQKLGVRVAGDALEPVFNRYFPLQLFCGVAAICTIWAWHGVRGWHGSLPRIGWVRWGLITLAFILACINTFWFAPRVHELRSQRYDAAAPIAQRAREDFGVWHSYSLWTDMAGLACVGVAFALAAVPPRETQQ